MEGEMPSRSPGIFLIFLLPRPRITSWLSIWTIEDSFSHLDQVCLLSCTACFGYQICWWRSIKGTSIAVSTEHRKATTKHQDHAKTCADRDLRDTLPDCAAFQKRCDVTSLNNLNVYHRALIILQNQFTKFISFFTEAGAPALHDKHNIPMPKMEGRTATATRSKQWSPNPHSHFSCSTRVSTLK
jgi:hypothetical protein